MKKDFCCGTCTSSRIESKHSVYKRYMNTSIRLSELFSIFKNLEEQEYNCFKEEITRLSKSERINLRKSDLIKHFDKIYSPYAIKILENSQLESVNYSVDKKASNLWYRIFSFSKTYFK